LICPLMSRCRSRILINELKKETLSPPWYAHFSQNKTIFFAVGKMIFLHWNYCKKRPEQRSKDIAIIIIKISWEFILIRVTWQLTFIIDQTSRIKHVTYYSVLYSKIVLKNQENAQNFHRKEKNVKNVSKRSHFWLFWC